MKYILSFATILSIAACGNQPVWTESQDGGPSVVEQALEIVAAAALAKANEIETETKDGE